MKRFCYKYNKCKNGSKECKGHERPDVENFLSDILRVYEKHGFSLCVYDDGYHGFVVEKYDKYSMASLNDVEIDNDLQDITEIFKRR